MSKLTTMDGSLIEEAIKTSSSTAEVLARLGFLPHVTYYSELRERCQVLGLELPRWKSNGVKKNMKDVLIENSTYSRALLKRRLVDEGYLKYKCSLCNIGPEWNNKTLVLQLDHINGVNNDNRLENLRFLCPNCHSQTDTWCGKDSRSLNRHYTGRSPRRTKKLICGCGKEMGAKSNKCIKCWSNDKVKIQWPDIQALIEMVKIEGYRNTSTYLNCSDNAIRKHLRKHNIDPKTLQPF